MNNQENMIVIRDPQANNLWLKRPRIYILALVLGFLLIGIFLIGSRFLNKSSQVILDSKENNQQNIPAPKSGGGSGGREIPAFSPQPFPAKE